MEEKADKLKVGLITEHRKRRSPQKTTMNTRLGKLLRVYRAFYGLKCSDVGEEIGINGSTVSSIELGKKVSWDTLSKVVFWLNEGVIEERTS